MPKTHDLPMALQAGETDDATRRRGSINRRLNFSVFAFYRTALRSHSRIFRPTSICQADGAEKVLVSTKMLTSDLLQLVRGIGAQSPYLSAGSE
jgi:hypothetical protein